MIAVKPRMMIQLQRGRTPESAERLVSANVSTSASLLQRGRTPESAERSYFLIFNVRLAIASTGPHSGECGEDSAEAHWRRFRVASTGPHSGECGELVVTILDAARTLLLQRGRTPESAESRAARAPGSGHRRFNGAALRRVRRGWSGPRHRGPRPRFNGAALRRVRRASATRSTSIRSTGFNGAALRRVRRAARHGRGRHAQERASTGPHSGECGEVLRRRRDFAAPCASTGPHSGECGELLLVAGRIVELTVLQRGRTPESAESRECVRHSPGRCKLQRGRTPESAESSQARPQGARGRSLQRGRTPESAESRRRRAAPSCRDALQRGRTPESAERGQRGRDHQRLTQGFNGAALRRVRRARQSE